MRKKKEHHEEHVDEAWLLPYSDMLTLLLALFIVMFAMGQTDAAKFNAMSQQFNIIFAGGSGVMQRDGNSVISMEVSPGQAEDDKMTEVKKMLEAEITKEGYSDKVKVALNGEGLEISIQDVVLFNTAEAEVKNNLSPLLVQISNLLQGLENKVKVVGYTDNVPIKNDKFRSNWELSAMRAINVMNFMVASGEISADKVSIQAYGEYMPKFENTTEAGRAKNRRVEIIVIRKYPQTAQEKSN
ncbi:chemotaxis protein MotB [Clostridium gelidum]|uniref:Chemotaxis protein MotB n=1 Tax=Clostridium gelidum TaxID=704125 RepID=A0ABN6J461_9CLOT|nr:flagellar motor protein MotB [Clostridium gelidum]BCZ49110.1 chemotaxis protein MotB [Clostridium gelidum]